MGSERFRNDEGYFKLYDSVYFPLYAWRSNEETDFNKNVESSSCEIVRFKVRAIGKENKSRQRFTPNTSAKGLFGMTTVKESDKIIVVTEGEFDAMAVH